MVYDDGLEWLDENHIPIGLRNGRGREWNRQASMKKPAESRRRILIQPIQPEEDIIYLLFFN